MINIKFYFELSAVKIKRKTWMSAIVLLCVLFIYLSFPFWAGAFRDRATTSLPVDRLLSCDSASLRIIPVVEPRPRDGKKAFGKGGTITTTTTTTTTTRSVGLGSETATTRRRLDPFFLSYSSSLLFPATSTTRWSSSCRCAPAGNGGKTEGAFPVARKPDCSPSFEKLSKGPTGEARANASGPPTSAR